MYNLHGALDTPPDETVIWRYMSLEAFLALLFAGLYCCRISRFEDPWEGRWPGSIRKKLKAYLKISDIEPLRNELFANCWHESTHESAALWSQYGRSAIAVRSTVGRLKRAVQRSTHKIYIGRVRYLNYSRPLPSGLPSNMFLPAFLKRKSFEHEREVRLVIYRTVGKTKSGLTINADLAALIEAVYISPVADAFLVASLKGVLKSVRLGNRLVRRSRLYDKPIF